MYNHTSKPKAEYTEIEPIWPKPQFPMQSGFRKANKQIKINDQKSFQKTETTPFLFTQTLLNTSRPEIDSKMKAVNPLTIVDKLHTPCPEKKIWDK